MSDKIEEVRKADIRRSAAIDDETLEEKRRLLAALKDIWELIAT